MFQKGRLLFLIKNCFSQSTSKCFVFSLDHLTFLLQGLRKLPCSLSILVPSLHFHCSYFSSSTFQCHLHHYFQQSIVLHDYILIHSFSSYSILSSGLIASSFFSSYNFILHVFSLNPVMYSSSHSCISACTSSNQDRCNKGKISINSPIY